MAEMGERTLRTIPLTSAAMLCFSANSLLCRLALAPKLIDPATFTSVRVASAAALLTVWVLVGRGHLPLPDLRQGKASGFRCLPGSGSDIASGALATGFGYIVWYLAVRDLTAGQAATVQLRAKPARPTLAR